MKRKIHLLPKHRRQMAAFGERLKLARLRRRISVEQVSERAGVSKPTVYKMEKGDPAVAMGFYFSVLRILGMEGDLDQLAGNDEVGQRLQDLGLKHRKRAPKQTENREPR